MKRGTSLPARAAAAVTAALLCALAGAASAGAAAPAGDIAQLASGTAILQYDSTMAPRAERRFVRRVRGLGVDAYRFRNLPMLAVRGSAVQLRRGARLAAVTGADMNERLRYFLHESVPLIYRGDQRSLWDSGLDGRGGSVAVIDSGVDGTHDDLNDRVVKNVKVVDPAGIFDERGNALYLECPIDCNTDTTSGHGTHVAGTAAGDGGASDGFYTGTAPGAGVVGLAVGEGINILYALAAMDYVLEHHDALNIVSVNNSWGPSGDDLRFDYTDPINQATKALYDAGVSVVFAAGNSATNDAEDAQPPGASDCGTQDPDGDGEREPTDGACKFNIYAAAPWVIAVAAGRKDGEGGPGDQKLAYFSSRGDPHQEVSLDDRPVSYKPAVTAPGVNVRAARAPTGALQLSCGASAEPPSCVPPRPEYEPFYFSSSGTSMAAPHVAGAIAVLQSKAQAVLGRRLNPDEVRQVIQSGAARMSSIDGYWDWPCGEVYYPVGCGEEFPGNTLAPYEDWQVGAGYLDVKASLGLIAAQPASAPAAQFPPEPLRPAQATGEQSAPPPARPNSRRRALRRCLRRASNADTRRQRGAARRRCRARYGSRRVRALERCLRRARREDARSERRAAKRRCRARYGRRD